jgi:uncharacterized protein
VNLSTLFQNFLNPPILFFFLGITAVLLHSDLDIPQPVPKFLSLYLLLSIGYEGGAHLRESGLTSGVVLVLAIAILMATIVPLYCYPLLRRRLDAPNAGAIAATYGSISAVTFITASAFLQRVGLSSSGHMVAAMALMESPAMVVGVLLVRKARHGEGATVKWGTFLRDALLNGSVFLLMGSLVIGAAAGESGWAAVKPFTKEIFKGMLAFFLLDMGILAAKRLNDLRSHGTFLVGFALGIPILNAALGMAVGALIGLSEGDALLFTMLCGSASYIAVPAAMRLAVPEANPSLYVPMSLAITFPFNIIIGIPLYASIIHMLWT